MSKPLKFFLWLSLALFLLQIGSGEKCESRSNEPTVTQTQEGKKRKFIVEVMNKCPLCPIINLRVKCRGFPQSLVDPTLLRVLSSAASGNCLINNGLPLSPMQTLSFNYSNSHHYTLSPLSWSFQCE